MIFNRFSPDRPYIYFIITVFFLIILIGNIATYSHEILGHATFAWLQGFGSSEIHVSPVGGGSASNENYFSMDIRQQTLFIGAGLVTDLCFGLIFLLIHFAARKPYIKMFALFYFAISTGNAFMYMLTGIFRGYGDPAMLISIHPGLKIPMLVAGLIGVTSVYMIFLLRFLHIGQGILGLPDFKSRVLFLVNAHSLPSYFLVMIVGMLSMGAMTVLLIVQYWYFAAALVVFDLGFKILAGKIYGDTNIEKHGSIPYSWVWGTALASATICFIGALWARHGFSVY